MPGHHGRAGFLLVDLTDRRSWSPIRAVTRFFVAILILGLGCSNAPNLQPQSTDGAALDDANGAPDDGNAGVASDGPTADAAIDLGVDAAAAINPVTRCPVQTMDQLYSGLFPPNPNMLPAADACVAAPHDVIIVLGCPNNSDGRPSTCQQTRADLALSFAKARYADWFITSGAAVQNQYVEGDTLKKLLVAGGIAADHVLVDARANHTDENLYYSSKIMEAHGFAAAIVISDTPGHFVFTALCDSNCCVDLGRLTVLNFSVAGKTIAAGHYVRYPFATTVSSQECSTIQAPLKAMCINLSSRLSCAGSFKLALDGGM